MDSSKVIKGFKEVFGFLSKTYWDSQDEYNASMQDFYDAVRNHAKIFDINPIGTLTMYDNEWSLPKNVDDTIDELDDDDYPDTIFVANWKDDEGNIYYTLMYKDQDEDDVKCLTRSCPTLRLENVPDKLIDLSWRPLKLNFDDGNRMYFWQSPVMDAYDFVELYKSWVTQYSSDDDESTQPSSSTSSNEDLRDTYDE